MNFRTTLVLLILACIGGSFFFLYNAPPAPTTDKEEDAESPTHTKYVLDPRPTAADVVKLKFERGSRPALSFERSGQKDEKGMPEPWRLVDPPLGVTESYLVDGIVNVACGLQSNRIFKPGAKNSVTAADAGLAPPQAVVSMTDKNGKEYKIEIGKKAPLSNDTFVRVAGASDIMTTTRDFAADLKRDAAEYRGKRPLTVARNAATRVQLELEGKSYDFAKSATADEWVMNAPAKSYAEKAELTKIVNGLANLSISEYVEDAPQSLAQFGLDKPVAKLTVTTEEKKPKPPASQPADSQPASQEFETVTKTHSILVGGWADVAQTKRFAKLPDSPWVGTITKESADAMMPDIGKLRDKRVLRVKEAELTKLDITMGTATTTLTRVEGQWTGSGDLVDLDKEVVKSVAQGLEDLRAIEFIDDKPDDPKYGFANPRATIKLATSAAVEPQTLTIGAATPSGRNNYVRVGGQSSVTVVTSEQVERIAIGSLGLRSRAIFSFAPGDLRTISLDRGDVKYQLKHESGPWQIVEPAGAVFDVDGVASLTNDLARLRAKQVVAKDADVPYGFDKPAITIRFSVEQTPPQPTSDAASAPAAPPAPVRKEFTLLATRKDGKAYCRRSDLPYVFELDDSVYKTFTGELIDRNLNKIAADSLTRIKITSNNGGVEFERSGKDWTYLADPSVKLNSKKVDELAGEIAGLRVEQYVKYTDAEPPAGTADAVTVVATTREGETMTLVVEQVRAGEAPRKGTWLEKRRSFLMRIGDPEKLIRGLDYYAKSEADDKPQAPGMPGQPGQPGAPRPKLPPPG